MARGTGDDCIWVGDGFHAACRIRCPGLGIPGTCQAGQKHLCEGPTGGSPAPIHEVFVFFPPQVSLSRTQSQPSTCGGNSKKKRNQSVWQPREGVGQGHHSAYQEQKERLCQRWAKKAKGRRAKFFSVDFRS